MPSMQYGRTSLSRFCSHLQEKGGDSAAFAIVSPIGGSQTHFSLRWLVDSVRRKSRSRVSVPGILRICVSEEPKKR